MRLLTDPALRATVDLWRLFTPHQRRQFVFLAAAMFFGALLEGLGIGLVLPLTNALMGHLEELPVISWVGMPIEQAPLVLASAIAGIFVIKGVYQIAYAWYEARVVYSWHVSTCMELLKHYLSRPYLEHTADNSGEILRTINQDTDFIFQGYVLSLLMALTEIATILCISAALLLLTPGLTLGFMAWMGLASLILLRVMRHMVWLQGRRILNARGDRNRYVQQGLRSYREVVTYDAAPALLHAYRQASLRLAGALTFQRIMGVLPKAVVETSGVLAFFFGSLFLVAIGTATDQVLAQLGLFAAAAFRMLPSANRLIQAMNTVRFHAPTVENMVKPIAAARRAADGIRRFPFERMIALRDVTFRYPGAHRPALRGVSINLEQGRIIGFAGPSGSGKSTLLDILLGLLPPDAGEIWMDGKPVQGLLESGHLGYVPQQVSLIDDTIRANVAFGVSSDAIDDERVRAALAIAQLTELVASLPEGLDTPVGENGVRLSGGQRQRIGIARAIYRRPRVLILDEATSALDTATEDAVMRELEATRGECVVVLVAHRLSTLRNCDVIYVLKDGSLVEQGSFAELARRDGVFAELLRFDPSPDAPHATSAEALP